MTKSSEQALANQYITKALTIPRHPQEEYWTPLDDAVLLLLDDFFNDKINTATTADISKSLYKFEYFTSELHCVNPELFKILDYLMALNDFGDSPAKVGDDKMSEEIINTLREYYKSKKSRVEFLIRFLMLR